MIIEDVERLLLLATALEYGGLHEILVRVGREGGALYLKASLIVTGTAAVGALFVNFLQVGPIIAPEAVQPQFSKLNPVEKLKQIILQGFGDKDAEVNREDPAAGADPGYRNPGQYPGLVQLARLPARLHTTRSGRVWSATS